MSEGSITIDGIDIRDLSLHALRGQLGYVPQKTFLFSGTVEENTVDYAADEAECRTRARCGGNRPGRFCGRHGRGLQN